MIEKRQRIEESMKSPEKRKKMYTYPPTSCFFPLAFLIIDKLITPQKTRYIKQEKREIIKMTIKGTSLLFILKVQTIE